MHPSATDADVSSGPSTCSLTLPPKSRSSSFSTSFIAADYQHSAVNINAADTMHSATTATTSFANNKNNNYNKKSNDNMREERKVSSKERHSESSHHKGHKRYQNNEENNYKTTSSKSRSLSCDMSAVFDNSGNYPSSLTSLVLPDMVDANQFVVHPIKHKNCYKSTNINNMHRPHDKYASHNNTRAERPQENQSANQGKLYKEYDTKKYNVHNGKRKSLMENEHTTPVSYYQTVLGRSLPNITSSHSSAKLFRHCSPLPRKPSKETNTVTEQEALLSNQMFSPTQNAKHHSHFHDTINNLFIHNNNYDNYNNNNNMTEEKRNKNSTRNYETNDKDNTKIYTNGREMSKSVNFNSDKISSNNYNTYKLSSKYDNMLQQSFDGHNQYHELNNAYRSNKRKQKHSFADNSQSSLLIAPWQTRSKEQSSSSLTSLLAMSTSASTLMTTDPTLHTPRSTRKAQNTNSSRNCSFARSITFDDDNTTRKLVTHHFERDLWDWMEHLYSPVDSINLRATRGTVKVEERLSARYSFNKSLTSTFPQEITQYGTLASQKLNKAEAERAVVVVKAVTVPIQLLHKSRSKQHHQHHHFHHEEQENNDVHNDDEEEKRKEWEEELINPWLSEQLRRANKMLKKYPIDNVIANTDVVKLEALLITDKNMSQSTFKNHVKHELETANGKITRTVFLYARPYVANVCSLAEYIRTLWLVNPFTEAKDALPLNREPNMERDEFVKSIASLLWQMVCALCKLHEMKLIHGNLKPNNVLVQKHHDTFYVYLTDYLLPLFPENYLEHLPLTLRKEVNNGSILPTSESSYNGEIKTKQKHNYARLVQTLHGSSTDLCFTYGSATPTKRANAKKHMLSEDTVQVDDNHKYRKKNMEPSTKVHAKYKQYSYQEQTEEEQEEEEEEIYIEDNEETEQDPKQEINMLLHLTAPECVLVTCPSHSELESSLSSTTKKLHSTKQNAPQTKHHLSCAEYNDDDDDKSDNVENENDKSFNACADVGEMLVKEANTPRRWKNNKHVSVSNLQNTENTHKHNVKFTFDNCNNGSGEKGCKKMHKTNKIEVDNEEQEQIWINETKRTEASDAYALGVLLHVMVIGYYPPLPPFQRAIQTHFTNNASFSSSVFASTQNYGNMTGECGTPHSKRRGSTTTSISSTKNKAKKESPVVYELQKPVSLYGITFQGYLWSVRNEEYINRKYGKGGERLAVPRSYQQSLSLPSDQHKINSLFETIIEGLLEPNVSNRMTLHRVKDLLETYFDKSITSNKQNKFRK